MIMNEMSEFFLLEEINSYLFIHIDTQLRKKKFYYLVLKQNLQGQKFYYFI